MTSVDKKEKGLGFAALENNTWLQVHLCTKKYKHLEHSTYFKPYAPTRGRCYDHNFLRFSTIFGEKIGVFPQNQCYDPNFA
jgi:hypothetical protein